MANLKITYWGTLFFVGMAVVVALIWAGIILIQRKSVKAPDLPPDFQQVNTFCTICAGVALVLAGMGV